MKFIKTRFDGVLILDVDKAAEYRYDADLKNGILKIEIF